eukprot:gb/GECH01005787.1/.p1 GENE.gb/GECH01005787.1/~~gb/GECH01005787.1/.p1  ORF type:complete len:215 (+),score=19.53 gb/GECH01005787.1/:1-645(+)
MSISKKKTVSALFSMLIFTFISISMIILFIRSQLSNSSTSLFSLYYVLIPIICAVVTGCLFGIYWMLLCFEIPPIATLTSLVLIPLVMTIGSLLFISMILCVVRATGDINTKWSFLLIPFEVFSIVGYGINTIFNGMKVKFDEAKLFRGMVLLATCFSAMGWLSPLFIGLHLDLRRNDPASTSVIPVEIGLSLIVPISLLTSVSFGAQVYQCYN